MPLERWLSARRPLAGRIPAAALMTTAMLVSAAGAVDNKGTITGTVTKEGVECPAVRGDDGKLYTVVGEGREKLTPGEVRPAEKRAASFGILGAAERLVDEAAALVKKIEPAKNTAASATAPTAGAGSAPGPPAPGRRRPKPAPDRHARS